MTKQKIIIAHDILGAIHDSEIFETLNLDQEKDTPEIIRFPEYLKLKHGETMVIPWKSLKASQYKFYRDYIEPILNRYEETEIYYFGLAPIPLAIHFGYLFTSLRKVTVFLRHHGRETWDWSNISSPEIERIGVPRDQFFGDGDVTFRFATAYEVPLEPVKEVIVSPVKNIEVRSQVTGRDIIGSEAVLTEYAKVFRDVMDQIKTYLENISSVHFFASVPVGLAFLIGREVNTNINVPIYTYEYSKEGNPNYREAFILQEKPTEDLVLSQDEKEDLIILREKLSDHLKEVVLQFGKKTNSHAENWFRYLFTKRQVEETLFDTDIWSSLLPITDTDLLESKLVYSPADEEGKKILINGNWYLPDDFLHGLKKVFPEKNLLMAIRLFWFHEVIKAGSHGVHSDNKIELARYPKILEETDYQADVYALLHEFKYSNIRTDAANTFFGHAIEVLIQKMWSVDRFLDPSEMELRRINHYLIWYYQLCTIKERTHSFGEIIEVLSKKPILELRLVSVTTPDRNKITIEFKNYDKSELGLAVFHKNRVITSRQQLPLDSLIKGFKSRNGDAIEDVIRQFIQDI